MALLLAGCSASSISGANQTSVPGPTATSASTPISVPQTRLTLADAWGSVSIHRLPTAVDDKHVFVFVNAATPDGQWLVGAIEPRNFINNTTELSVAVLYNVNTKQFVRMHALLKPQSQVMGASADDKWVVWSEADDQPNFFDWTLFAYNRQTGSVRQLAQAVKVNGHAVPGAGPFPPLVAHDRVFWGQAIGPVSAEALDNLVVRMEDLTTGAITTLATKAGTPMALAWPWIAWAQISTGSNGYETLRNMDTGQEVHLDSKAANISFAGTSLAYDDVFHVFLVDDINQAPLTPKQILGVDNNHHLQWVTLSDRLIAWTEDAGVEVWDRTQHVFVQLPISNGLSDSWVQGHLLVWFDPEPADQQQQDTRNNLIPIPTLDILDTTTLPTKLVHG